MRSLRVDRCVLCYAMVLLMLIMLMMLMMKEKNKEKKRVSYKKKGSKVDG